MNSDAPGIFFLFFLDRRIYKTRNKDVSVFTHRPTQLSIPLGKWKINPADERSQGSQTALRGLGPWGLASIVNNFL